MMFTVLATLTKIGGNLYVIWEVGGAVLAVLFAGILVSMGVDMIRRLSNGS
jgi:hypothetical protein